MSLTAASQTEPIVYQQAAALPELEDGADKCRLRLAVNLSASIEYCFCPNHDGIGTEMSL